MKSYLLFAVATFLLCSCDNTTSFPSGDSKSNEEPFDSSAVENIVGELDPELRQWWAKLSTNRGVLSENGHPFMAFYGEADQTINGGLIHLKEQGTFSYYETNTGIEFDDYIGEAKTSSIRGLRLLSRLGPDSFESTQEGYRLHSPSSSPFGEEWLSLINENRAQSALQELKLTPSGDNLLITSTFSSGDNPEDTRVIEISQIGKTSYQELQNMIDYPPSLTPRTSFDQKVLRKIEDWTGKAATIPFPLYAPIHFADRVREDALSFDCFDEDISSSYIHQLINAGFQQEGTAFINRLPSVDVTIIASIGSNANGTHVDIAFERTEQEASSFLLLNVDLADSTFPAFPKTHLLLSLNYSKSQEGDYDIEAVFKTVDAGISYIEGDYIPVLKAHQFLDAGYRFEKDGQYSFRRNNSQVQIFCGESAPAIGFPFHITLSIV